ncbi:MAG TPA: hypothetical protein PLQ13_02345, partial [Candidatus Krumholzibacteria bacterium]|nr:hypothetical protein [Candidatus Krumholzibacteria bacterium]
PVQNPDGRDRFVHHFENTVGRWSDREPGAAEHDEPWPGGRVNHYLFDMNRDWFTMVNPESRRSAEIAGWVPQLVVDSHEQGANSTYLFPPARHPFNPLLPSSATRWVDLFSAQQAAALDARGYPYFRGEWNEEFFPGYGSSWSRFLGGVGILYEMSRTTGALVRKHGGTVRTFAQAVEHQLTSSVANLETLRANAAAVLEAQAAARGEIVEQGRKGKLRAWVFPPDPRRPERTARLARVLTEQGIEVQTVAKAVEADGLVDARTGASGRHTLMPGALLVRMDQPSAALARVILDPHVPMDSGFFRDEREYIEKGKGSRLYDTTAWSLAIGLGVPAYWSAKVPAGAWEPWQAQDDAAPAWRAPEAWVSVIFDGDPDEAQAALADLLQQGVTVRAAAKAFTIGGRAFAPGAFVVRREGNDQGVGAVLEGVAARHGLQPVAVTTYSPDAGPDLGGGEFDVLVAPRVGVLTGMPVSTDQYGWIWHLLDQDLDLRFSALDVGSFARTDLSRYNVLVFPPVMGGPATYRKQLGLGGMDALRRWVEAGGTAIGIGDGAGLLAGAETGLTATRFRAEVIDTYPSPVWSIGAAEAADAGRPTAVGLRAVSGGSEGEGAPTPVREASPYDVAPVLGAGARPFAEGRDQGTALGGAPVAMDAWLQPVLPAGRKAPESEDRARADGRLRSFMPQGALLNVELDGEFWLDWGLDEATTVLFGSDDSLIAAPPARVAARFADPDHLHVGGLLWPEAATRLARTGYAVREGVGRGQVVLFADNPVFRRWMRDSERMFVNAVLLGPGLGTRWSTPW